MLKHNPNGLFVLLTEAPNEENGMAEVPVFCLRKWVNTTDKKFWYPNGSEEAARQKMFDESEPREDWRYLPYTKIRFSHGNFFYTYLHSASSM